MMKPVVLLDPSPRKIRSIFSDGDFHRLTRVVDMAWGKDEPMPPDEIAKIKGGLWGVVTGGWRYGAVTKMPRLKVIMEVMGQPIDPGALDYPSCYQRGVHVLCCSPVFAPTVAEMALGLAICCSRGIVDADRRIRLGSEKYNRGGNSDSFTLWGKRVGFIGFGGIARCLKKLLDPFAPSYCAYDPWLTREYLAELGVEKVDLDTVLGGCQYVFVLAMPTKDTAGMISRQKLELIRKDAVFILVSRAQMVDFDALIELADSGRFRAGIDVFPKEPIPPGHAMRRARNVVLTPHVAGHVPEDFLKLGSMIVDDLEAIAAGGSPSRMQIVQPETIARMS